MSLAKEIADDFDVYPKPYSIICITPGGSEYLKAVKHSEIRWPDIFLKIIN
jgi:hypothetical protein